MLYRFIKKIITTVTIAASLFFSITQATYGYSHIATPKFQQLTTADGLSQSYVFSIVQDQQGFMWFATADGLNRYDGFEFVHYRHNIENPNSLPDNYIRTLFIDSKNQLWVGTSNGLSRYNASADNFTNFHHNSDDTNSLYDNLIWSINEINQGTKEKPQPVLIVATEQGLQTLDLISGKATRVTPSAKISALKEVKTIIHSPEKNEVLLGTFEQGLYIADKQLTTISSLSVPIEKNEKWNIRVNATSFYDAKLIGDKFWLATDNGLFVLPEDLSQVKHLPLTTNKNFSQKVRIIAQSNDEEIYAGTEDSLYKIASDYTVSSVDLFEGHETEPVWFMSSLTDINGNMWLGTFGNGLYFVNHAYELFTHADLDLAKDELWVLSIVENEVGDIYFNNEKGNVFVRKQGSHKHSKLTINAEVQRILDVNSERLLFLTFNDQLVTYKFANKALKSFNGWQDISATDKSKVIYSNNSVCAITDSQQLACYYLQNKQVTHHQVESESALEAITLYDTSNIAVITENKDVYIKESNSTNLSFFASLDIEALKHFKVNELLLDEHHIWLSSTSQGITKFNYKTKDIVTFNEKNSIINNLISGWKLGNDGTLWIATNRGIYSIGIKNNIRVYERDYGLHHIEYNQYSILASKAGNIYVGHPKGYISFNPVQTLSHAQELIQPLFTKIEVANKALTLAQTRSNNISLLKSVEVAYKQFPLSISFISPNAALPQQVKYKYRLTGLEENWIETTNDNRRATYTNLSPGTYLFEVVAYDKLDNKTQRQANIEVVILPPWWLSTGAWLIYSLIATLLLAYFLMQLRHRHQYHFQIKKSEERLKLSLWGSGDEMWDWNIKTQKVFRSNIWGLLEFPQDGTRNVGTEQTNIHPNDIERVKAALNEHFDKQTDHFEITYRVQDKNDNWLWILDRGKVVERDEQGKPVRMTGTLKDISHIKKAEERLKLFAKCIENISDAVVIYDRQFNIVDVNKSFVRITGKARTEMVGKQLRFNRYPDSFTQAIKKHLVVKGNWQGEIESRRNGDETYYTDLTLDVIRDESNNISHFVGVFSDITARKKSEADLRKLANSDTLTGLPNRSYFQANQQRLVKSKIPHALLVFDLDNFKKINDSMGHQIGDIILVEVAKRIMRISSKRNSVYRLGGDEFSIIIENTNDLHTITSLAKDILKLIALPLRLKNQEIVLYSSIGIVLYPEDGATPAELLKNADTAMYHAKDRGGNRYQFFSDSMNKEAVQRLKIEQLIRAGLKDDYFSVFYQPKIEITTGKVAGMEALVRFETPTKGIISPVVFIPISEETGQIIDIGEIVLRKSCFAAKKWLDAGLFDGRVAVNLSAVQFTQPNLPKMIASILEESQLPAKHLELEITEGTVMNSPQQAIDTMLQIRAMGIHLALDDFGTGYSSLAYLKKFPLNTLKIDKAFVDDIETSDQGRNMVATIVTIAHNLGMHVVAEGVENNNQLNFLLGLGCEQLQGYLYSKPLPEAEFQKYLLSHQITDQSANLALN